MGKSWDEYMTFYDELVSINRAEDSQTLPQLHKHSTKSTGCQFSGADSSISVKICKAHETGNHWN